MPGFHRWTIWYIGDMAASVGTILVALAGPVLGTMADTKGFKKPIFTAAILTGVASCALLGLAKGWLLFLVIYIIAKVGFFKQPDFL